MSDTSEIHRKRLLLLAYHCSPYKGSERGIGWHRAIEVAKYCDTWVMCKKEEFENDISRWVAENGTIPGLSFVPVPMNRFEKLLERYSLLWYCAYNLWHRQAYHTAARLHKELEFDIVHLVTIAGFREPGYLWKLDAPFIWGPVGGTQNYPWRFLGHAGIVGGFKEGIRTLFNKLQFRLSKRVRRAAQKAEVVLTANSQGKQDFERVHKVKPCLMLDVGATIPENVIPPDSRTQNPLRILWSGVFEHRKALHLLLMALGEVSSGVDFRIRILGGGPLEKRWRRMARKYRIDHHCSWMGRLSHAEALAQYEWADVFVFTSLRDTCGTVVLEALSRGVPVICLDHQGAGDVITDQCGIKISVTNPKEVVAGLRDAIVMLVNDRQRLGTLSKGAIDRSKRYLWEDSGRQLGAIYKTVSPAPRNRSRGSAGIWADSL